MKRDHSMAMYKSIASVCLLSTMVILILCSCTPTSKTMQPSGNKQYVALISKSKTSAFWLSVFAGAGAAATEYNLKLTCEAPDTEEDYETQNRLIEQAVKDGADAIVFSACDYDGSSAAIDEAAKSGVKIIVIDSDVNSSYVETRIGTDNYMAGIMAGKELLRTEEEVLHVGLVNYDVNTANGQERERGLRSVVEADKRVQDITTINVVSTTIDAKTGTEKMLQEHPDINAIATFNEWTSLGVGYAIRDMELSDSMRVIAFDSNVVNVGMLEIGEVDALIVQNPYAMGYLGIEAANKILNGQKPEITVDTATTVVTRDNMYDDDIQRIVFAFD